MPDETLLTLKQLAAELSLPESTVRYYRDAFLDHIPSIGTGRRRRYPPQAVAVLRSIAMSYAAGRSRAEIAGAVERQAPRGAVAMTPAPARTPLELDSVSNLDLLAAILDGEREQRDALWQMAKEIVRLAEVLEGQDKIIVEIADRAGVAMTPTFAPAPPPAPAALSAPQPAQAAAAVEPPDRFEAPPPAPIAPQDSESPPVPVPSQAADPAPPPESLHHLSGAHPDMDRLRAELETERELVERLQDAKLKLEHRAADAEAELEHRRGRRSSVIKRLLGSEQP